MAKKTNNKKKSIDLPEKDVNRSMTPLNLIIGLLLIAFSLLLFFSVLSFTNIDLVTLKQAHLSFIEIVSFRFPPFLSNMIGPFGAVLSYVFIRLFGKPFAFFIAIFSLVSGLLLMLGYKLKKIGGKLIGIFSLFALITLFYLSAGGVFSFTKHISSGLIFTAIVKEGFVPIFKNLGSSIIFGLAILGTLLSLIGIENFFNWVKKSFKQIFGPQTKRENERRKKSKKLSISYLDTKKQKAPLPEKNTPQLSKSKKFTPAKKSAGETEGEEITNEYILPKTEELLDDSHLLTRQEILKKEREIETDSKLLMSKLNEFGLEGEVTNVNVGPIVTQYEVHPAPGLKISKFTSLADDLALAMKAKSIRIVAPIPGKDKIGFEIPNKNPTLIKMKDVLNSEEMRNNPSPTLIALGKDITGKPFVADLKNLRHLLIAGLTGSGKSVCLNVIINSILYRTKPEEVRFILFDPKKIELSIYEQIPHLIKEVITDPKDVLYLLNWATNEMEKRYDLFAEYNLRNIDDYHQMIKKMKSKNKPAKNNEDGKNSLDKMPYIIIVVDELADLMQSLAREIEKPLRRLSGMARAVGIYLLFATQRPSVDVVNGMIKANFPSRISFQVYSKTDSRTVLDVNGAEKLLGQGDMLFSPLGKKPPIRVHGSFVSTEEVKKVVKHLSQFEKPEMDIELPSTQKDKIEIEYDDDLFPEAARVAVEKQYASVSMMQRRFHIGYARAGRLINIMEEAGIVGGSEGSKARKILVSEDDLEDLGL